LDSHGAHFVLNMKTVVLRQKRCREDLNYNNSNININVKFALIQSGQLTAPTKWMHLIYYDNNTSKIILMMR